MKKGEIMDTITFNIHSELKREFQIACIKKDTKMTDELIKFIKEFVKD